jgi:hypothetical protein
MTVAVRPNPAIARFANRTFKSQIHTPERLVADAFAIVIVAAAICGSIVGRTTWYFRF